MAFRWKCIGLLLPLSAGCYAVHVGDDDRRDDAGVEVPADGGAESDDGVDADADPGVEADGEAAADVRPCPPGAPEVCDHVDNDCDGRTDEDAPCSGGATCVRCICALPCNPLLEFPCPGSHGCDCSGLVPEDPTLCLCVPG